LITVKQNSSKMPLTLEETAVGLKGKQTCPSFFIYGMFTYGMLYSINTCWTNKWVSDNLINRTTIKVWSLKNLEWHLAHSEHDVVTMMMMVAMTIMDLPHVNLLQNWYIWFLPSPPLTENVILTSFSVFLLL
jgi:hypothetical protein